MKIVIFAGGSGRRLWPISLKSSPKQFEPIIGDKSTVQLAVDRVLANYGAQNVFISTNLSYLPILAEQLPMLPTDNLIGEPVRRDLAAAVGLALAHLAHVAQPDEPVAILWGDNYMEHVETFRNVLTAAEQIVSNRQAKIVFVGETPRFANENLGWIGLGARRGTANGLPYFGFNSLTYRPALDACRQMFAQKSHVWNTGYFVTTVGYIQAQYQQHAPQLWDKLATIAATIGTADYDATLSAVYPQLDVQSFDDAILHHIPADEALVLHEEMGWSDPGTLYALKEAINPSPTANVERGLVVAHATSDSLLYNYESDKLLAVVGLDGMIVVNTQNAILVVHKDQVPLVKQMVNDLVGSDLEKYT